MPEPTSAPVVAAPVVVTPIPAHESRTLWFGKWASVWTVIAALAPDVIGFLVDLWSTDPAFAAAITDAIPLRYRVIIGALVVALVRRFVALRKVTTAPIAGTPSAEAAQPLVGVRQSINIERRDQP